MIAEEIYNGATAEDLGMPDIQWKSRKATLDDFLSTHSWDPTEYLKWLRKTQKVGKPLPSAVEMAKSLAASVAAHVASGFEPARDEAERVSACIACVHMRSDNRCSLCGCYTKIKAKWASARCPDGRWPE